MIVRKPVCGAFAALAATAFLLAAPARAELVFVFVEAAPADRFEIVNAGACATGEIGVGVSLRRSAGGLFFDTSAAAAGLNVHQPFQLVEGGELVREATPVNDGDTRLTLRLADLAPGARVAFTIDVDDSVRDGPMGRTRIDGSEIAGARAIVITGAGVEFAAPYGPDGAARVPYSACQS